MREQPPESTVSSNRVADLLAPTLGTEKSSEVVAAVVLRLALPAADLSPEQALAVLDELARTAGMVGIAARFARSRLDAVRIPPPASAVVPADGPSSPRPPPPSGNLATTGDTPRFAGRQAATTVTAAEVAALLASAMGTEKAREIVLDAVRRLGLAPDRLDKAQAMTLLDHLAAEPGVVGLCARFGKARLILRFAA